MNKITLPVLLAAAVLALAVLPLSVQAQCSDCWYTPTPPPTGTATPAPGTGTPTAVPPPASTAFPVYNYGIPTPMPTLSLPAPIPTWQPSPIALPSPVAAPVITLPEVISISLPTLPDAISVTIPSMPSPVAGNFGSVISPSAVTMPGVPTAVPLASISTTIPITYTLLDSNLTTTGTTSGIDLNWLSGVLTDVVSYTNYLTETAVESAAVITVVTAPADYVPDLPRPLADIGWTFEQVTGPDEAAPSFSIASWGTLVGYMSSMPFQLVKALWIFGTALGPVGLFLAWLIAMFNIVITIKLFRMVTHILMTIIDVVIKIIDLIGQYAPTGG